MITPHVYCIKSYDWVKKFWLSLLLLLDLLTASPHCKMALYHLTILEVNWWPLTTSTFCPLTQYYIHGRKRSDATPSLVYRVKMPGFVQLCLLSWSDRPLSIDHSYLEFALITWSGLKKDRRLLDSICVWLCLKSSSGSHLHVACRSVCKQDQLLDRRGCYSTTNVWSDHKGKNAMTTWLSHKIWRNTVTLTQASPTSTIYGVTIPGRSSKYIAQCLLEWPPLEKENRSHWMSTFIFRVGIL